MTRAPARAADHAADNGAGAPPVRVRRSPRARRIRLRIDPVLGDAELVLPQRADRAEGERFVARHRAWIARQLAALPPRRPFVDGARLPVMDSEVTVVHRPDWSGHGACGPVRLESGRLVVGGSADRLAGNVAAWLRAAARDALDEAARRHAEALGGRFTALRIGDPRSRWGSCSPRGTLSFSWRLVLAPARVLDYVAAHETAHLLEANHGPRFWRLVESRHPDWRESGDWLRRHGPALHRYGD